MLRGLSKKLIAGLRPSREGRLSAIELIACDLDGTLLNRDDLIAPSTAALIRRIEEQGVRFVVITRRHHGAVEPYVELIRLDAPIISLDGALVRPPSSNEVLYTHPFDQEFALDILDEAAGIEGIAWGAVTAEAFHLSDPDLPLPTYHRHWNIETRPLVDPRRIEGEMLEVLAVGDFQGVNRLFTYVEEKMRPDELKVRIYESYSTPDLWYLEVRSAGATKERALEEMAGRWGIPLERVVGIGDHYNDIGFCSSAGYVVAMRNAVPELKEIADFVTQRECLDEGIDEFLRHFLEARGVVPHADQIQPSGRRRSR